RVARTRVRSLPPRRDRSRRETGFASFYEHLRRGALGFQPIRNGQILRPQEGRVEELGGIADAGIAEQGHDRVAGTEFVSEVDGPSDVYARGTAEQQPFLN